MEEMETELQGTGEKTQDNEKSQKDSVAEHGTADEKQNLSSNEKQKPKDKGEFTMMRLLKSRELRMPLFIAMFLQVIQQLSGINAVSCSPVAFSTFSNFSQYRLVLPHFSTESFREEFCIVKTKSCFRGA
jgi:Sugar (and other) transporter